MEIGPLSAPYLLVPVMAMAQVVNVSRSGEEPDPTGSVPEDVRLHDSSLADSEGDASMPNLSQLRRLDVSDLGEAAYHSCVLSCDEEQHCRDAC